MRRPNKSGEPGAMKDNDHDDFDLTVSKYHTRKPHKHATAAAQQRKLWVDSEKKHTYAILYN